jgi:adenine deaminase
MKKIIRGNLVDIVNRQIYLGELVFENGFLVELINIGDIDSEACFLLPGLVDAHVHIESSMLIPSLFARLAVSKGVVAAVADPHEIANVLGLEGIGYMVQNGILSGFNFSFGVPSCVPATSFETSGFTLDSVVVDDLLSRNSFGFLSEMMNFPGVVFDDKEVIGKLCSAKKWKKPVDGHAPGLKGADLDKYVHAGISTDHEATNLIEALEKIKLGMKILIREGSAAKNFEALVELLTLHPEMIMFCTDDCHPDDLLEGYMDRIVRRAIAKGFDIFDILRAVTLNPKLHYGLNIGLLQVGDPADFIVVDNLLDFNVCQTYIKGNLVYDNGVVLLPEVKSVILNNFDCSLISKKQIEVEARTDKINVISAQDGGLYTLKCVQSAKVEDGLIVSDIENDVLKIVVVNRYINAEPVVGFIKNIGIKSGAYATSVAHDSHNIIAVGTSDDELIRVINKLIENKGGIVVSTGSEMDWLELPVAGLMSVDNPENVANKYASLNYRIKLMGSPLTAPIMTLSFMSLLVIPEFKIGDKGLFDGLKFEFASLYA